MKFLVSNYSCLQNPWLGGYRPQIPVLSVLCTQLNLLNPPPNKIPGYATAFTYILGDRMSMGDEIFRICPEWPRDPHWLLYEGYPASFPEAKRTGMALATHPSLPPPQISENNWVPLP